MDTAKTDLRVKFPIGSLVVHKERLGIVGKVRGYETYEFDLIDPGPGTDAVQVDIPGAPVLVVVDYDWTDSKGKVYHESDMWDEADILSLEKGTA